MRLMSFAATTEQMRDRSKTVTRRIDSKGYWMRVLSPARQCPDCDGFGRVASEANRAQCEPPDDCLRCKGSGDIPGTLVCAVEKGQGLPKGESIQRIGVIEIVDVRREALSRWNYHWQHSEPPNGLIRAELDAEGFTHMASWGVFVALFRGINRCEADVTVTRIEFRHRPDLSVCCGAERGWVRAERLGSVDRNVCTKCGRAV